MLIEIILGLVIFVFAGYLYVKKKFSYFKERGIPYEEPSFPFGNAAKVLKPIHHAYLTKIIYDKVKGKFPLAGIYVFTVPVIMATDLDLIKRIFSTDFQHFHDRTIYFNEKDDPLSANLVSVQGQRWKKLRNKLTPTFTSSKISQMMPLITKVADQVLESLQSDKDAIVDAHSVFERYTIDVIGTCAFGIECNSVKNPKAKFRQMWNKVLADYTFVLKIILLSPIRELARKLKIRLFSKSVSDFFIGVVKESIDYRLSNNIQRPDLIESLIKLMKKNETEVRENLGEEETDNLTLHEIAAQVFVYFLAGFDTSSTTLSFTFFELARHQQYQDKAREHIKAVMAKHNNELTYEAISEMTYLDQCINEGLRKYPPAPVTSRCITKDYKVPGTELVLKKDANALVIIPIYSIHHDPEYYPDPDVYDPERFSPEESSKRIPYTFLPFGAGPRVCPGYRFAMTQIKTLMVKILLNYRVSATTDVQIEYSTNNGTVVPKEGVPLRFTAL